MLARPAGVQLVPGWRFGADGTLERYLRLPYTQSAEVLERAVTRVRGVWATLDPSALARGRLSSTERKSCPYFLTVKPASTGRVTPVT